MDSSAIVGGLAADFRSRLAALPVPDGPAVVGVSGGADSLALLDLLATSPSPLAQRLEVLHVDHGIAPNRADAAAIVRAAADRYELPHRIVALNLDAGASETVAREARWRVFRESLLELGSELLFLGHTADDQIETLLMRFLRGSGPAGLVGMQPYEPPIVRPLLSTTHAELLSHCRTRGLVWWDDPANDDRRHDRSWIRHVLLPLIAERWPDSGRDLARISRVFLENRMAWDEIIERLPELDLMTATGSVSVAVPELQGYSSTLRRSVVRALGRRLNARLGSGPVDRIETLVMKGHTGQRVDLGARGAVAELAFGRLRLFRPAGHPPKRAALSGEKGSVGWGQWTFSWEPGEAPERLGRRALQTWVRAGSAIGVRGWQDGDRLRPLGGQGSRLVVRCMQDERVPRGERTHWPVIEDADTVVWVPGVCRSEACLPEPGARAVRIDASRA